MSVAHPGKGEKYLAQLDQALCNGNWAEVPELARKTEKHAPERQCFTLTARTEAQIAIASHRPTSAASATSASIHSLGEAIPKLSSAIEKAALKYSEDAFAARVCLAEISWLRDEKGTVLEVLSETPSADGRHAPTLGWLEVCEAKAAFLRSSTLESSGKETEARESYLQATARVPGSRSAELRRWTERLLARACMFTKRRTTTASITTLCEALRCFNAWSDFWQRSPPPISQGSSSTSHLDVPRREVWRANYELLSTILSHGLMYGASSSSALIFPSDDISDDQYSIGKLRQRAAMKRVESTYESLLLNETQFPKATQTNVEVEKWAEQVVSNWKIFSGPEWTDAEHGEGGKEQIGRGVLDVLYRAATKTFHSTAILRHLYTVHAALGDFDLAIHALNSYIEIVDKGKARSDKNDHHDSGLDDDDTAVLTVANAVQLLCRYGDRDQAEKALESAKIIRSWLKIDDKKVDAAAVALQPKTMAAGYRAMGVSRSHWARLTYENESRSSLRAEAVVCLRQALQYDESNLETSYALALVLADSRDVSTAMDVLRHAFATQPVQTENIEEEANDDEDSDSQRARDLVPLWHLMALCLTAKDEHEQGARMCEAAFEQFGDAATLFGEENSRFSADTRRSLPRSSRGVIDEMESFEKAELLRVKMSQLTLLELMEGAEVTVDASHELLALYTRLFGSPDDLRPPTRPPQTANTVTPSKGGGTLRSLAGSIRPKSMRSSIEKATYKNGSMATLPEGQSTTRFERRNEANDSANGVPISITVTNEDGEKAHDHHVPFKLRGHQGDWREHSYLRSKESAALMREKAVPKSNDAPTLPAIDIEKIDHAPVEPAVDQPSDQSVRPDQPLTDIQHNQAHDTWPVPAGHDDQPPYQDVRLPVAHPASASSPEIRLSSTQERRHKISLLVDLWMFIAGLYLRADLYDDTSGAIMEAHKLVELTETDAAAQQLNARGLYEKRWGGGKSVDMLWADVWSAKGQLASARGQPFRALEAYEQSVAYFPDHPRGIIGLSNILMDIYEQKIPIEEPQPLLQDSATGADGRTRIPPRPSLIQLPTNNPSPSTDAKPTPLSQDPSPAELHRLAARDRAYMLLSNLTRLGTGWDNSEAWLTLARAHELSKQLDKAKQALWWVVELEENQPIRPWSDVGGGSFTL